MILCCSRLRRWARPDTWGAMSSPLRSPCAHTIAVLILGWRRELTGDIKTAISGTRSYGKGHDGHIRHEISWRGRDTAISSKRSHGKGVTAIYGTRASLRRDTAQEPLSGEMRVGGRLVGAEDRGTTTGHRRSVMLRPWGKWARLLVRDQSTIYTHFVHNYPAF
jgi:hypothetical protein